MGTGGLPVTHVENLIARSQIVLWSAVTAQAPLHLQRFLLVHKRHLVNRAVAGVAAHAFVHVNAVIEENEIGKLVHARPLQRLSGAEAGADWFEQLGVGPNLRMAIHASLGGRNAGETGSLH
jgi:hypothetical protein